MSESNFYLGVDGIVFRGSWSIMEVTVVAHFIADKSESVYSDNTFFQENSKCLLL